MSYKVTFIGIGIMGRGIVKNLQKHNIHLTLYSRDLNKIKDLENSFTIITDSLEDSVKNSDFIILCLTTDEVVNNIFNVIKNHIKGYLIDFGTTSPELTEKINNETRKSGNIFIDSPMTGSKLASENAQITYMVGANSENELNYCRFLWEMTGKKIIHCGKVGQGQKAKISLNMIQASILQAYMEGLILAKKLGVSENIMNEIISSSAAKSGISDFKMNYILEKDYSPHFSLKNMNKDLNHAIKLAMEHSLTLPQAFSIKSIYHQGILNGLGENDFANLMEINLKNNHEI